jgi:hypothetical protein
MIESILFTLIASLRAVIKESLMERFRHQRAWKRWLDAPLKGQIPSQRGCPCNARCIFGLTLQPRRVRWSVVCASSLLSPKLVSRAGTAV